MNYDNFDVSAMEEEFARVTTPKNVPGAPRKYGNFLDKIVKMPKGDGYVTLRLLPPFPGQKLPYASCCIHNLAPLEERFGDAPRAKNLYCGRELQGDKWVGPCLYHDFYNHLYR